MKLLFDYRTKGHHLEYIHHLYMMMVKNSSENYVIVVPKDIKERGKDYFWPEAKNVMFDYIPSKEAQKSEEGNLVLSSYRKTKLLKKYINKYHPSGTFLNSVMAFMPFLPFMVARKYAVTGILYKIYLYEWSQYSRIRKSIEVLKYECITFKNCLKHVMILNDSSAVAVLNKIYRTDKFIFLSDPFNKNEYIARDIRGELGVRADVKLFIHFGSMNRRKGTLNILKALLKMSEEDCKKISLVIAGLVREDIKTEFYQLLEEVKKTHAHVLVFDKFCSNEFIADLCCSSDFILIPYEVTAQSSGLIGYAANYCIPVIGPSNGLLGKLIRRYKLGIPLQNVDSSNIAAAMAKAEPFQINSDYLRIATIENFQRQIEEVF